MDTGPGGGTLAAAAAQPAAEVAVSRAAMAALRVGVLLLDSDDHPVLANPAARAMGLVRGRPDGVVDAHTIVRTLAGQVRRSGVNREVELELPRPRGIEGSSAEPLGVHVRASALEDGHVVVEAADVTEAHRVARVRRDFVANVSHELKTPVGALQLLAEALLEATDDTADEAGTPTADLSAARRFAERIQRESTRLGRLVSELLELSRLQGAEPLPEPQAVTIDRIIAEVIDRTRTPASAKDIEVVFTGARELVVFGSESQLVTALTNLVENAIAYSPEDTRVTISTHVASDHVELRVVDQGIGIEPRDLDRIFERFYRADKARSRATGGTGLGLAIVKHIATNHAGRVDVASTVGEGSTFTLRLPARPPDASLPLPRSVEIGPRSVG
ncbi:MAG: two-component system, OmpR family, sensor histidine kinase SenX3 [Micromonosporaceae bacterium]|nr:two-component system, OmpR family, sensor histidine kinase SenX3 [Micromonosporaceae bacterium]